MTDSIWVWVHYSKWKLPYTVCVWMHFEQRRILSYIFNNNNIFKVTGVLPQLIHARKGIYKGKTVTVCSGINTTGLRSVFHLVWLIKTLSIVLQKPLKHMSPHLLILANTWLGTWGRMEGEEELSRLLSLMASQAPLPGSAASHRASALPNMPYGSHSAFLYHLPFFMPTGCVAAFVVQE